MLGRKASAAGFTICLMMVLLAVAASAIAPYDPIKIAPATILKPPSSAHWFGTDELGRDVLTRLIFGARVSIAVGAIAITIALCCGGVLGMLSGYYGGWIAAVIMRAMDALAAFPAILLALAILSALGPGIRNAMIAVGVVYVPAFSRVVRGSVLSVSGTIRRSGAGDGRDHCRDHAEGDPAQLRSPCSFTHRSVSPTRSLSRRLCRSSVSAPNRRPRRGERC